MIPQVGGFQGCYPDNHRNDWRCARAVRKRPLRVPDCPLWGGGVWLGEPSFPGGDGAERLFTFPGLGGLDTTLPCYKGTVGSGDLVLQCCTAGGTGQWDCFSTLPHYRVAGSGSRSLHCRTATASG